MHREDDWRIPLELPARDEVTEIFLHELNTEDRSQVISSYREYISGFIEETTVKFSSGLYYENLVQVQSQGNFITHQYRESDGEYLIRSVETRVEIKEELPNEPFTPEDLHKLTTLYCNKIETKHWRIMLGNVVFRITTVPQKRKQSLMMPLSTSFPSIDNKDKMNPTPDGEELKSQICYREAALIYSQDYRRHDYGICTHKLTQLQNIYNSLYYEELTNVEIDGEKSNRFLQGIISFDDHEDKVDDPHGIVEIPPLSFYEEHFGRSGVLTNIRELHLRIDGHSGFEYEIPATSRTRLFDNELYCGLGKFVVSSDWDQFSLHEQGYFSE
jgi:hypothetical protein